MAPPNAWLPTSEASWCSGARARAPAARAARSGGSCSCSWSCWRAPAHAASIRSVGRAPARAVGQPDVPRHAVLLPPHDHRWSKSAASLPETVGAWLQIWTPPRDVDVPAVPVAQAAHRRRRRSPWSWASRAAIIVPRIDARKRPPGGRGAAARARARWSTSARRQAIAEQRAAARGVAAASSRPRARPEPAARRRARRRCSPARRPTIYRRRAPPRGARRARAGNPAATTCEPYRADRHRARARRLGAQGRLRLLRRDRHDPGRQEQRRAARSATRSARWSTSSVLVSVVPDRTGAGGEGRAPTRAFVTRAPAGLPAPAALAGEPAAGREPARPMGSRDRERSTT